MKKRRWNNETKQNGDREIELDCIYKGLSTIKFIN